MQGMIEIKKMLKKEKHDGEHSSPASAVGGSTLCVCVCVCVCETISVTPQLPIRHVLEIQ